MKPERLEVRIDESTLEKLDNWRSDQPGVPNRSESIRQLILSGVDGDRIGSQYEIIKLLVITLAANDPTGKVVSNAYLFAWKHSIYPIAQLHGGPENALAKQFSATRPMMEQLARYLDRCNSTGKVVNFYELEEAFRIHEADSDWSRSLLIEAVRYLFNSDSFTAEFWESLMGTHQHPLEASGIRIPIDSAERTELVRLG
jgi:hypothetical protein